ncbi:Putative ribonuclease H protein At1g65750 [Linum perenne]
MLEGSKSAIRDGKDTLFWTSNWVDYGLRLIDLVESSAEEVDLGETVAEFTTIEGQWDFERLSRCLPPAAVDSIAGMLPPNPSRGEDVWIWGREESGVFSIRSAYELICNIDRSDEQEKWTSVWKWVGPNRVRFFLWLAAKEKLLTNVARVRRGMTTVVACHRCAAPEEMVLHVLRDCPFACETWKTAGGVNPLDLGWQAPLSDWLLSNIKSDNTLHFGIVCWHLWRARNESIFAGSSDGPSTVAFKSIRWRDTVQITMDRDGVYLDGCDSRRLTDIAWQAGPLGGVTLNSDGSVLRGKAAARGLLRDSDGRCLAAYAMNLGSCTITRAEIRGALEGIKWAWEAGYRKLEVQLDSKAAVAILSDRSLEITHGHGLEVIEFREWMSRDWELEIKHVYREANFAADHLASRGHDLPRGSHWIDPIDCRLAYFVRYDCMGLTVPRLIIN